MLPAAISCSCCCNHPSVPPQTVCGSVRWTGLGNINLFSWDTFEWGSVPYSSWNGHTHGCTATTKERTRERTDWVAWAASVVPPLEETIQYAPHSCKTYCNFSYALWFLCSLPFRPSLSLKKALVEKLWPWLWYPSNFWSKFWHLESFFSCNKGSRVEFSSIVLFLWAEDKETNNFSNKKIPLTKCIFTDALLGWLGKWLVCETVLNEEFWIVPTFNLLHPYYNRCSSIAYLTWFWSLFGIVNREYFHRTSEITKVANIFLLPSPSQTLSQLPFAFISTLL